MTPSVAALQLEYEAVVAQFRELTQIRFKLLAFLPLGTVATIAITKETSLVQEPALAAFGAIITICFGTYNARNDQHYDELVSRAAEIERALGLYGGSFSNRPATFIRFGPIAIEHRWPIGLIYASSCALWMYLFFKGLGLIAVPALAAAMTIALWLALRVSSDERKKRLRVAVETLQQKTEAFVNAVRPRPLSSQEIDDCASSLASAIGAHAWLFARSFEEAERRLSFQHKRLLTAPLQNSVTEEAAYVLAAVIDQPARWILDRWSRRR